MSKFVLLILCFIVATLAAPEGLYGLSEQGQLFILNSKTGANKAVGPAPKNSLTAQSLATVDIKREIYYSIFFDLSTRKNYAIGLDMNTGAVKVNWTLPFAESPLIGIGQYIDFNPNTGSLIVTGQDSKGIHQMISLDPNTGKTTQIATVGDIDVLGGASAFDAKNNIEFIELGVNKSGSISLQFLGFDINSGKVVTDLINQPISTLSFNPHDGYLYGFGLQRDSTTTWERSTVRVDGKTGKVTTLGTFTPYKILSSSIAALDFRHTILYGFFMEPSKNSTSMPFDLVGVSVENRAKVVTHPVACKTE